jgi:hypothetical protein
VQQRCRREGRDEDGSHNRVPSLTTTQLLRRAFWRSRDRRRPVRVNVAHHGSIIYPRPSIRFIRTASPTCRAQTARPRRHSGTATATTAAVTAIRDGCARTRRAGMSRRAAERGQPHSRTR